MAMLLGAFCAGANVQAQDVAAVVQQVDRILDEHWQKGAIKPAAAADDATVYRRVMLDLAGRVPTIREAREFAAEKSPDKFAKAVQQIIDGPEFDLHFATVLDDVIQDRQAGNEAFVDYLRRSLRQRKGWDAIFRELLVGPWEAVEQKPASGFLDRRAGQLDLLAIDTSRAFFGVDISCAKCHDHPLAPDWTQDHFYGMAAFLNRTTGGKGNIGENTEGEVKFLARGGQERVAPMMFLSGRKVDEPAIDKSKPSPKFSRREQLVQVALDEKAFLRRAFVNRMWESLFGRGLVHPVDQMHSANPPAIPELLELLAQDFGEHGYDMRRLVTMLTLCRAYRLSSDWLFETPVPDAAQFGVARLRPLSPRQLAFSLLIVLGDESSDRPAAETTRIERLLGVHGIAAAQRYLALEKQAVEVMASLDARTVNYQATVREALFVSNGEVINRLFTATDENLAGRLAKIQENGPLIDTVFQSVFHRAPTSDEAAATAAWLAMQDGDRRQMCAQLVWSLATSAEFRFNH